MNTPSVWTGIGTKVLGYSHKRQNKPNQDAYSFLPESRSGTPIVLTVADGHGSSKAFRSEIGSQLAVETTAKILWDLVTVSKLSYSAIHDLTRDQLPDRIVRAWNEAIATHLQDNPFTLDEQQYLITEAQASKQRSRTPLSHEQIEAIIRHYPYGTTLLGVVITESFIMYLQLGDGDIVCLDTEEKVYHPFPIKDERLIANETTSLCQLDAWRELNIVMQPNTEKSPLAIVVSTDGYSNSFATESDFLTNIKDYYYWIQEDGLAGVEKQLEGILEEITEKGSGDDITLGILSRIVTTPPVLVEQTQIKQDNTNPKVGFMDEVTPIVITEVSQDFPEVSIEQLDTEREFQVEIKVTFKK